MSRKQTTYRFKAGDEFTLDHIYAIQGLAGGDWWERTGEDLSDLRRERDIDLSESLRCTRDVKITIIVETPPAPSAVVEKGKV